VPAAAPPAPEPVVEAAVATAETAPLPPAPAPPTPVLPAAPLPAPDEVPDPGPDPALPLALVALSMGGLGLFLSQVPYGPVALAAVGLLVALAGLASAERSRLLPAAAAALNPAALPLAVPLPGWLGLASWRQPPPPDEFRRPLAIPLDRGAAEPADWVDVSR